MISSLSNFDRSFLRRPYWLVLVLALFFAGQVASSAHWHDAATQLDVDCALCMLSGANGAAVVANVWQPLSIPLGAPVFLLFVAAIRRIATRFHDSRAPPHYC
ncbi:MAG TPA: hypothetical protein VLC91_10355 [Spongiibacteraceae bacterium]|nr:hypothetical protein [Spongiibacteraceae bacterium]